MKILIYAIIFHIEDDFNVAMSHIQDLNPTEMYPKDIEMIWDNKHKRSHAINVLKNLGITVDTYEIEYDSSLLY